MSDRIASYLIGLGADSSDLTSAFAQVKSRVRSEVAEIKQLTDKLDLFGSLTDNVPKVQQALDKAKQQVQQFTAEVDKIKASGEKAPKALTDALAQAEKAAASATKELARQQAQLGTLSTQLQRAGVDTSNLSAAQAKLEAATKAATEAAALQAAKQALGLKTLQDIQPEIAKLRAAYDTLKTSGTASSAELAAAQERLNAKIKELNDSVTKTGSAFRTVTDTKADFSAMVAPMLAAVAAFSGVTAAISSIVAIGKEFKAGLREIGIETNATKEQIGGLGTGARQLAIDLGINVADALRGIKELLRGGLAPGDALEALRASALAAKAAMVDLDTGIAASKVLLQGFRIPVKDLSADLDILNAAAKAGGPTLAQFASGASELGVVAKAVNADFLEVVAALTVMTKATGDASGSAATLQKILINLNGDNVQKSLRDLGISGLGVAQTFAKLDEKGLNINEFLALGVANTRAAVGVGALKEAAKELPKVMDDLAKSTGAVTKEAEKLAETGAERLARFRAAAADVAIELTANSRAGSAWTQSGITLLEVLKNLTTADLALLAASPTVELRKIAVQFGAVQDAAEKARIGTKAFAGDTSNQVSRLADSMARAVTENKRLTDETMSKLRTDSAELIALSEKIRSVGAQGVAEINTRAQTEIDAIARTADAQKVSLADRQASLERFATFSDGNTQAVAAAQFKAIESERIAVANAESQILAIQQKAAADRLSLIQDTETKVSKAIDEAFTARRAEAGTNELKLKELSDEEARVRIANVGKTLEAYRSLYTDLLGQSRTYVDKVKSIEGELISFNKGIADAIREIQNRSLSGADAYGAKLIQIEDSISRAQQARLNGNHELERQYTQDAINGARALGETVDKNGRIVITQEQAQADALRLLDKVSDNYNESLGEQETAAQKGARATQEGLNAVKPIIEDLQKKLDTLLQSTATGITIKINKDIDGLQEAEATLNRLARDRTVRLNVQTGPGGGGGGGDVPLGPGQMQYIGEDGQWHNGLNAGGPVLGPLAQKFAGGGAVFNRPTWTKVPGVGNTDTVPALLQEGSFVVKKSASQFYGDGLMSRLARGYAGGGAVTSDETDVRAVTAYAQSLLPYLRSPVFDGVVKNMADDIHALQRDPNDGSSLKHLIGLAQSVAANYSLKDYWGHSFTPIVSPPLETYAHFLSHFRKSVAKFAGGGGVGTDTVPAMLTPGEFVFRPEVVKLLGGGFLSKLNNLEFAAPPKIAHFANGGPVGGQPMATAPGDPRNLFSGVTLNMTINAAGDNFNDPAVQRRIAAGMRDLIRRTGNSAGLTL